MDLVALTAAALLTAFATGLGALPFIGRKTISHTAHGASNAAAAGLMAAASVMLIAEAIRLGIGAGLLGLAAGGLMVVIVHRVLDGHGDTSIGSLRGAGARAALMVVLVLTAHSFAEGIGVGVAYADTTELGVAVTIAIAVHNIPEGIAVSLVLIPQGVSVARAAGWSIFTSLPQPLMAVPAYLAVEWFRPALPAGLGFAAGAMLVLVAIELIPEARLRAPQRVVWGSLGLAFIVMMVFQAILLGGSL
jgi:zinc transporter ZupT